MDPLPADIIENVHRAFSEERRPVKIEGCPCCIDAEELARLVSTPLRQISSRDLGHYAASVFLTVGSEADFRYFLPRILEVRVTELHWWPDPEVVGKAMANIPWKSYTSRQQEALTGYFDGVFTALLASPTPHGYEIDSWLCGGSFVLPAWGAVRDRVLDHPKALVALYERHAGPLQKRRLGNGFWDDSPQKDRFLDWMLSGPVQVALRAEWGI